ncbi:MAG TPA: hypothetical protein VHX86_14695 [Tepidisphaeraceae bacterium]|nr:hypothetical protein [Tepidisphaeraceae bacterium]
MRDPKDTFDQALLDMRSRCLSLAADLDRLDRAPPIAADSRLAQLRTALGVLSEAGPNRAERVQMIFSDKTPPPPHGKR